MKKDYIKQLYFLIFGLILSVSSFAQLVVNDDVFNNINSSYLSNSGPVSVLENDTFYGGPLPAPIAFSQISTSSFNVNLSANNGYVYVDQGTPAGTYYIEYQVCTVGSNPICETATVTVNVCSLPELIVLPHDNWLCTDIPGVTLVNLPETGTWTVIQRQYNMPDVYITGTGQNTISLNLPPGGYSFKVTNESGCSTDFTQPIYIGYMNPNQPGFLDTLNGTVQDLDNNGIINPGDIIFYELSLTHVSDCPLPLHFDVFSEDGSFTFIGAPVADVAQGVTDTSITGYYTITQNDINNGNVTVWLGVNSTTSGGNMMYTKAFTTTPLNIPDGFKLNAFLDNNNNGIQDNGEQNFNQGIFNVEMNANGAVHNVYPQDGSYVIYESNPLNTYNVGFISNPGNTCEYVSTVSFPNITVAAGSGITTYNFPVSFTACTDVVAEIYGSAPRPGLPYWNEIYYYNNGNTIIDSGTVSFIPDPAVTIFSISEAGTTPTPMGGFTYDFTNLLPGEYRWIFIQMQVPPIPTVNLGDQLTNTVSVAIGVAESNIANNTAYVTQTVVGSYDPNDKAENHGGKILHTTFTADDYLTYTIRFENTGTAEAFNVRVTDVLDAKLDENSIRMVNASHNYILDRVDNNLEWKFNGINLFPAVADTEIGKGYIVFQVKPKAGYTVGDIVSNTADIYFDANPPIITNAVTTEFVSTLGVNPIEENSFSFYPNPVKNTLTISGTAAIQNITVVNILGQEVFSKNLNEMNPTFDLSNLKSGIYIVKVKSANGEKAVKVTKN